MKACLINCYLNHHQLPFSLAMERLTCGNFTYISAEPISQARLDMGYPDLDHSYPFLIAAYDGREQQQTAMERVTECDLAILGSAPDSYLIPRMKQGKVTFKYSERPCKQKETPYLYCRRRFAAWVRHGRFQKYPLYMLCASAYTAGDYARFGDYLGKTFKWGYFPEVKEENLQELFTARSLSPRVKILWAGRFLDWKHPEAAINAAAALKKQGYSFRMDMIGTGPMEKQLQDLIDRQELQDQVRMLGSMKPEQVRQHMENSDIYLFTSDFNEGWGAVLNESMNSGCAVIASHAIGSAPYLLKNGENGIIYENGNQQMLNEALAFLLDHPDKRQAYGRKAYETLKNEWNADAAAERVIALYEHLKSGKTEPLFTSGPCSPAEPYKNEDAKILANEKDWKTE